MQISDRCTNAVCVPTKLLPKVPFKQGHAASLHANKKPRQNNAKTKRNAKLLISQLTWQVVTLSSRGPEVYLTVTYTSVVLTIPATAAACSSVAAARACLGCCGGGIVARIISSLPDPSTDPCL